MKDLSLIIPCYNEEDNIPLIVKRCREIKPEDFSMEVLLVNNGSKDKTAYRISELTAGDDFFRMVEVKENKGYGFGILSGLEQAEGKFLAWTHADMQTDPFDVIKGYQLIKNKNNEQVFVKGSRKKRAFVPWLFTFGMSVVAFLKLKTWLPDIGAQPKIFSKEFFENHLKNKAPNDFALDLFAMYQAKKHGKIITFPVVFLKRLHGEAKGGGNLKTRIKVTQRVIKFIFEMNV